MSDDTRANDELLDELIGANWAEDRLMASDDGSEAVGQKIVNAALRVREARAAVAARMSSPSHDRAMAEGGWQSIASAPITQDVLLFCPDRAVCPIVVGGEYEDGWLSDLDPLGGELHPTHWMPLPKPPGDKA